MSAKLDPSRPVSVRGVLALAKAGAALGVRAKLEPEALMREARRRDGSGEDFEAGAWQRGLERLCEAIASEAQLHALGSWIAREQLVGHLLTRLRRQALLRTQPQLREAKLAGPVVVVTGMQRTGTTKLQRLLAADPRAGGLLSWEALEPVPDARKHASGGGEDYRIAKARRAEQALRWMAPVFFAIHPVEHLAQEEDVLLLDPSFRSTTPEAIWSVPSFSRWLEGEDLREAYAELRQLLLILQAQRPRQWWVLKTPHHLEHLEVLHEVIPEAKVVWTHRDPLTTVASFCSMVFHGRRVYSDAVDPREVGRQWSTKVARMVSRGLEFRAANEGAREQDILDLRYEDLLHDPIAQIERIYAFAGLRFDAPARAAMEATSSVQVQHRYGVHRYQLEDFGLDKAGLAAQFSAYRRRFGFDAPGS